MGELMYIEEAKNEEVGGHPRWVEDYPGNTGEIKSKGQNHFYCWREAQKENGYEPWVPFRGVGVGAVDNAEWTQSGCN